MTVPQPISKSMYDRLVDNLANHLGTGCIVVATNDKKGSLAHLLPAVMLPPGHDTGAARVSRIEVDSGVAWVNVERHSSVSQHIFAVEA